MEAVERGSGLVVGAVEGGFSFQFGAIARRRQIACRPVDVSADSQVVIGTEPPLF